MLNRDVLVNILRITRDSSEFSLDDLRKAAKIPGDEIREQVVALFDLGMLTLEHETVSLDTEKRLRIALEALNRGADLEKVCRFLSWQEFEEIAAKSLQVNGFSTFKHFVFVSDDRRREIDVVGVGHLLVVCLDCKHWMKGIRGGIGEEIAARQVERVQSLAAHEPSMYRLGIRVEKDLYFIPAIVSLVDAGPRFIRQVPMVPVLKLNSFLSSIDPFVDGLLTIKAKRTGEPR
jgi:hypothetical protein